MTSEAQTQTTNPTVPVTVYRKITGQLVVCLQPGVTPEEVITAYYKHATDAGEPAGPAELLWDAANGTLDIGAAELVLAYDFEPSFSIVADEPLSGDALNSAIMEEEKLEQEQPPAHYRGPEGVQSDKQINEEPTLDNMDLARIAGQSTNNAVVTAIRNNGSVTKIQGNSQVTKIGQPAQPKLANQQVIERLVNEGIGARAKNYRNQTPHRQRQPIAPAVVVHHTERGRELLATALSGHRGGAVDGVDFINTSGAAQTKLGAMLDINAHVPFQVIDAGEFASVGAFWYFVASESPDESVRYLHGAQCRHARHHLISRKVEGFNRLIAEATWAKVCTNEELKSYMTGNDLRYRCFFTQEGSNYPVSSNLEAWYMPILEEIGNTLKRIHKSGDETLAPDFSFLERRQWGNENAVQPRNSNGNNNQRARY